MEKFIGNERCTFLSQSTEISFTGSKDPHSIFFVVITKGKM